MDQDNTRGHPQFGTNMRIGERAMAGAYGGIPTMPNNMLPYSYMYSTMPPLYYPSYPYSAYQYPNSSYLPGSTAQWRDTAFAPGGLTLNPTYPRNFGHVQNSRVTPREPRDKQ